MDWWQIILSIITTILATFVGASVAFYWERRNKENEKIQDQLASANRAIFILSRQYNILNQLKKQIIDPVRNSSAAWIKMRPTLQREHYDLKY
jgi:hypothetical protein